MSFVCVPVNEHPWEEWRPGVKTRNWSAEIDGAQEVHVGEQIFEVGCGVPSHWHTYEEHLIVLSGRMELVADGETRMVAAPACCIIHPRTVHAFSAVGDTPLHIMGAIGSPVHESRFLDTPGEALREYEASYPAGARHRVSIDPVTDEAVVGPAERIGSRPN